MSEATERLSREAAAALHRSLSSPFGRYFDDPEIDAVYLDALGCAQSAHTLFSAIRDSKLTPQEMWEFVARLIRELFVKVQHCQEALEGECGSDPYRDFAVSGSIVSVGTIRALSAHGAALALGKWILDEVWEAVFDYKEERYYDRPWNRLAYLPPDELDLKAVEQNYAAVVRHFQTLAPWDVAELCMMLHKEAIVTGTARAGKQRASALAAPLPGSTPEAEAANEQPTGPIPTNPFAGYTVTLIYGDSAPAIDWQELLMMPPLSAAEIAAKLAQPVSNVERVLRYVREKYPACYSQDDNARTGAARFRYKLPDVIPHLQNWMTKRQRRSAAKP